MATENEVDLIWARDQLRRAGVNDRVATAVYQTLDTWNTNLGAIPATEVENTVDALRELLLHHSLLKPVSDEVWMEAYPGFIHAQDVIRVRHDAYDGELGEYHNGRVGKCLGVRSGMIIFRSTDEVHPFIDGAQYPADKLERRVS
jgi:hypothetical protein